MQQNCLLVQIILIKTTIILIGNETQSNSAVDQKYLMEICLKLPFSMQ